MFGDLNRVEILGNITSDPELKYTSSGTAVLNLGIATNRSVRRNDEWKDETEFHNVVFWGNLATNLAARVRKGTRIYAVGRLQTRSWESDGKKNYRTEIHVSNNQDVILIARYDGAKDSSGEQNSAPQNSYNQSSKSDTDIDPDDLPF